MEMYIKEKAAVARFRKAYRNYWKARNTPVRSPRIANSQLGFAKLRLGLSKARLHKYNVTM